MGVIFQDFVRYNLSAADPPPPDRERIRRAAERSQADEVIARLPGGYDQMIGKRFKKGVELSGGEWQKMAIARAYMREAQVLILDEPNSSPRCPRRIRSVQALQGTECRENRGADLAPLFQCADGGPHRCWREGRWRLLGHMKNCLRSRGAIRSCLSCRPRGIGRAEGPSSGLSATFSHSLRSRAKAIISKSFAFARPA